MKRRLILSLLFLITFAAGFYLAGRCMLTTADRDAKQFLSTIKDLRQRIYGRNYDHYQGIDLERKARLAAYDPATSKGSISVTTSSIWSKGDHCLRLRGDGALDSVIGDQTRLITTLGHERTKELFQQFLTSGILNYSEGVIDLKKDLVRPPAIALVDDAAYVEIRIFAPELEVDKSVTIYAPDVEVRNYPDIIENQIFIRLEKSMLDLVPAGDADWSMGR